MQVGAYGDDASDRSALVAIARRRALEVRKIEFDDRSVVLVGDTPHDISAALGAGVRAIGVATGHSSPEDLAEAGAADVLQDLTDLRTLRKMVG